MREQPVLDQLDGVVRDMDAALEFYRQLGLPLGANAAARSGGRHGEVALSEWGIRPRWR